MRARRLTEADAAALRVIRLAGLKNHPLEFGADHDEEASEPPAYWRERLRSQIWFGVEAPSALIACASVRITPGKKLHHNAWLHAMYSAPDAQGGGAAHVLMDFVEDAARALGATCLKLYAREGNERAVAFYRRRGFTSFGCEPHSHVVDGVSYHSLEFYKDLPAPGLKTTPGSLDDPDFPA